MLLLRFINGMNGFLVQENCAVRLNSLQMELASPSTALSPAVKQLLCCVGMGCDNKVLEDGNRGLRVKNETRDTDGIYVTSSAELKLDRVASLLPVPGNTALTEYFKQAVGSLAPVFLQCQHAVVTMSDAHVQSNLLPRLQWTYSEKIFSDCLEVMKEHQMDGSRNILVLLLISAVLERALGNVFLLQGTQCPSLLKDLLVTDELANTLGDSVMQLLPIVIGPPTSLNLRNVAWHGFLGDEELSCRYCCFLVLLTASIGDILSEKGTGPIPQRPFFSWTPTVKSKMLSPAQSSEDIDLQSLKNLLTDCVLIQPQTEKQWQLVFYLYMQGRYGYCFALLLPLLEHCLRRVFATVNACPERVLTAESAALYTTFNEMLEQTLPDGATNRLPEFLTVPCMDLLHDLLFYPEGPRVRDHLSHGEMDFASVGGDVVYPFLCVAVFLAYRLRPESSSSHSTYIKEMVEKVKFYRSVFHPVASLQQKFAGLLCQLEKTESCVVVSPDLESVGESGAVSKLCEDNLLLTRTQGEILSLWKCEQWAKACSVSEDDLSNGFTMQLDSLHKLSQEHIPTLFRWQFEGDSGGPGAMRESEFVGLLVRITEECSTAMWQMQQSLRQRQTQLFAKELRSRQRENLKKLLICLPCLQVLVASVAVMLGWNMQHLHSFSSIPACKCRMMQKHLKQTLQHCEKLRTFTSSDRNKWTESVELLTGLIPKCRHFFVQWFQQPDSLTTPKTLNS